MADFVYFPSMLSNLLTLQLSPQLLLVSGFALICVFASVQRYVSDFQAVVPVLEETSVQSGQKVTQGCPCGYFNHPEKECTCSAQMVQRYLNKVSGPLLDRIDLHVEVTPVSFNELSSQKTSENSDVVRERVVKAREVQVKRFESSDDVHSNAQMSSKQLKEICTISQIGQTLLKAAMDKLNLSARAYDRILKVARTIADLESSDEIMPEHLAEAIQYRSLDREGWGG